MHFQRFTSWEQVAAVPEARLASFYIFPSVLTFSVPFCHPDRSGVFFAAQRRDKRAAICLETAEQT